MDIILLIKRLKKIERCNFLLKGTNEPEVIANLHNKEINGLKIKIYRLCSGVRGLNQPQMDRAWNLIDKEGNQNGLLEIVDYDGMRLFDKIKQHLRRQIVIDKIDELREKGFPNIIMAGQSCGGFLSIFLTAHFPDKIKGSIATNPACYGENVAQEMLRVRNQHIQNGKLLEMIGSKLYHNLQKLILLPLFMIKIHMKIVRLFHF